MDNKIEEMLLEALLATPDDASVTDKKMFTRIRNAVARVGLSHSNPKAVLLRTVGELLNFDIQRYGKNDYGFVNKTTKAQTRPMQFGDKTMALLQERLRPFGVRLHINQVDLGRGKRRTHLTTTAAS